MSPSALSQAHNRHAHMHTHLVHNHDLNIPEDPVLAALSVQLRFQTQQRQQTVGRAHNHVGLRLHQLLQLLLGILLPAYNKRGGASSAQGYGFGCDLSTRAPCVQTSRACLSFPGILVCRGELCAVCTKSECLRCMYLLACG